MGIQYDYRRRLSPDDLTAETVAAKIGLPLEQPSRRWSLAVTGMGCVSPWSLAMLALT